MNQTKKKLKAAARRPQVATLYLKGWSQGDLAAEFNVNQSTISRDLEKIQQGWLKAAKASFDAVKAKELARIDRLEREYWEQYEASKKPFKKVVTKGKGKGDAKQPTTLEKTTVVEDRLGDSRYLVGIQWCVEQRLRIFGVYEETKIRVTHTWRDKVPEEKRPLIDDFFSFATEQAKKRLDEG